jgi:transcriptional antiterminator RfaH
MAMNWYLIHTKPRQEKCALQNLERQGYECYLPIFPAEKLRQGALTIVDEPLFPRYLFIRLDTGETGKSWGPIRSTKGVSRLVTFGVEPAKVNDRLIEVLHAQASALEERPQKLFAPGECVMVTDGAFAGIEAVYQMSQGENRAMVLIEVLSKSVRMSVAPARLRKVG